MTVPSPADFQALTVLYGEYSRSFDSGSGGECAALFADDGSFVLGDRPAIRGRDALGDFFGGAATGRTHHHVSNILVEKIGSDSARGSASVLVLRVEEDRVCLTTIGRYEDVFTRVDGQWKIQQRNVIPTLPERLAGAVLAHTD